MEDDEPHAVTRARLLNSLSLLKEIVLFLQTARPLRRLPRLEAGATAGATSEKSRRTISSRHEAGEQRRFHVRGE